MHFSKKQLWQMLMLLPQSQLQLPLLPVLLRIDPFHHLTSIAPPEDILKLLISFDFMFLRLRVTLELLPIQGSEPIILTPPVKAVKDIIKGKFLGTVQEEPSIESS